MVQLKVPGIIGGAWVDDVQKAMVTIPGWAEAFNQGHRLQDKNIAWTISPWANRCISIRMSALSKIPWEIQQNDVPLPESQIGETLKDSNLKNLLRLAEADLCLYGRAFWQKGYAGLHLTGLRRLNSSTMTVKKQPWGIEYFEQNLNGRLTRFSVEEIVYFHEFDPLDDLDGIALAKVAELAIEAEYNADRYISAFFRNYAIPPVVFSTEADLPSAEAEKAEAWWRRLFGGVRNQFKAGFLGRGLKPNVIGFSPDKLALTEVREEARRSICATFGVPPTVANAADPGSYATADEQRQSLYEETIIPRAEWYAEQINDQIISHYRSDMEFVFNTDDLEVLQEDEQRKAERLGLLVEKGIITEQTAGAELGYSPEEIGKGRQEVPQFGGLGGFGSPFAPQQPPGAPQQPPGGVPGRIVSSTLKADEESGGLLEDLKRWRRKALRMVKSGKSAAVEFQSESIRPAVSAAILGQLDGCKTANEVHAAFDRVERDMPGRKTRSEDDVNIHVEPHIHIQVPDIQMPDVHMPPAQVTVNVEPTPFTVTPSTVVVKAEAKMPDINIENRVDVEPIAKAIKAGAAKAAHEPRVMGRSERHKLIRKDGEIVGSEAEMEYHYED